MGMMVLRAGLRRLLRRCGWFGVAALGMVSASAQQAAPAPAPALTANANATWVSLLDGAGAVAVNQQGDVFVLARDGVLWQAPAALIQDGQRLSWSMGPGRYQRLRATQDGAVWAIDDSGVLYKHGPAGWTVVTRDVRDVAATPDGVELLLMRDGRVRQRDSAEAWPLPEAIPMARLLSDEHGLLWLISESGKTWRWDGHRWRDMPVAKAGIRHIEVCADGTMLGIDGQGAPLLRKPEDPRWVPLPGTGPRGGAQGLLATDAACAPNGTWWLVSTRGELWARQPVRPGQAARPEPLARFTRLLQWRQLGGLASDVSVAPDGSAYILDGDGRPWRWQGEDNWSPLQGRFKAIVAGADGLAWALDEQGVAHEGRQGLWDELTGRWRGLAAGPRNSLWAVDTKGALFGWQRVARLWEAAKVPTEALPQPLQALRIGADGMPWVIDGRGMVQQWASGAWRPWQGVEAASLGLGAEGTVYAVDRQDQSLWWLDVRERNWKPANGRFDKVAVGPKGAPWAISTQRRLMISKAADQAEKERVEAATQQAKPAPKPVLTVVAAPAPSLRTPLDFQILPGQDASFVDIGIGTSGATFAVGGEGGLYCYQASQSQFKLIGQNQARRVAVTPAGQPWLVSLSAVLSHHEREGWRAVPDFLATDVSVAPDGQVWALNLQGDAYRYLPDSDRLTYQSVNSSDAPVKARRIAGASDDVYWLINEGNMLLQCAKGVCTSKLLGARDVAVAADNTVFVVDLLGAVRRYNAKTRSFDAFTASGVSLSVAPQGLPWLVTSEGRIQYAGALPKAVGVAAQKDCAQALTQGPAPAPTANGSATLQVQDDTIFLNPGNEYNLLPLVRLFGRQPSASEVQVSADNLPPWLSLSQGVLRASPDADASATLSIKVCTALPTPQCASGKVEVGITVIVGPL
jgi:Tectonin domain